MSTTALDLDAARRRARHLTDRAVAADVEYAEAADTGRPDLVAPAMRRRARTLEVLADEMDRIAGLEVDHLLADL